MSPALTRGSDVFPQLVTDAGTLHEWLAHAAVRDTDREFPNLPRGDPPHAAGHGAGWCDAVARGDVGTFTKRLSWDGLTPTAVAHALEGWAGRRESAPKLSRHPDAPLPAWAAVLAAAYGTDADGVAASFAAAPSDDRAITPDAALPFEPLFLPLLAHARREVGRRAADPGIARADAYAALERALLARLTHVCSRALFVEFSVHRATRQQAAGLAALFAASATGVAGHRIYQEFVDGLCAGGLIHLFARYPVLARLCGTVTDLWIDATVEFLDRVRADFAALAKTFAEGHSLGHITAVRTGLSDPHEGGRSVLIVDFAQGLRAVYKPRPVGVDRRFGTLLEWLNAAGLQPGLRPLTVLDRGTHGWIEFAAHAPCADSDGVGRFYRRCGALLCTAYALNGSDFHLENLIAAGDTPLLIDLETLLGPKFDLSDRVPDQHFAPDSTRARVAGSVLNVRMLPLLKVDNDGAVHDVGGFGGAQASSIPLMASRWSGVNTDVMRVDRVPATAAGAHNVPVLGGVAMDAGDYVEHIVAGFREAYEIFLTRRAELTAPGGVLHGFRRERVRFILRNTSLYAALLERCLHPAYLRDGVARSVEFEALCRPLVTLDVPPAIWPALAAEYDALEHMDIPLFSVRADERTLNLPTGATVPWCFARSAYEEMEARLASLGDSDLAEQIALIQSAFLANRAAGLSFPSESRPTTVPAPHRASPSGTALQAGATAFAVEAADRLCDAAVRGPNSEVGWLGIGYMARARRYAVGAASANLFDGYVGLAYFLAAVGQLAGPKYRDVALSALRPLSGHLTGIERVVALRRSIDMGAGVGLGSIAIALVRAAPWLEAPELVSVARRVGALLTLERVVEAEQYDLLAGAAGAIVALLELGARASDAGAIERAHEIGRWLVSRRTADATTGFAAWVTHMGHAETGLGHGQAGIAYALLRLAAVTGASDVADAAVEAIAHERAVLAADPERQRDRTWGRGTSGIALARLHAAHGCIAPALLDDVEAALDDTSHGADDGSLAYCTGVAGRAELFLGAAAILGRPRLRERATQVVAGILERVADAREGAVGWAAEGVCQLGLFHGTPGVAYQLLRVADPVRFPPLIFPHVEGGTQPRVV